MNAITLREQAAAQAEIIRTHALSDPVTTETWCGPVTESRYDALTRLAALHRAQGSTFLLVARIGEPRNDDCGYGAKAAMHFAAARKLEKRIRSGRV